jgi:hypothetical protein
VTPCHFEGAGIDQLQQSALDVPLANASGGDAAVGAHKVRSAPIMLGVLGDDGIQDAAGAATELPIVRDGLS